MAGRLPKPTKLKVLTGNPGKRALNQAEPQSEPLNPAPPEWLDDLAKEFWAEIVEIVAPMGHVLQSDRHLLMLLALELSRLRRANKDMEDSTTVTFENGTEQVSPHVTIANQATKNVAQILAQMGMSPSARSRIVVNAAQKKDSFDKFLGRKKRQ